MTSSTYLKQRQLKDLRRTKANCERLLAIPKWQCYAGLTMLWALPVVGLMLLMNSWPTHPVTWMNTLPFTLPLPHGFFMAWLIRQSFSYSLREVSQKLDRLQHENEARQSNTTGPD